MSVKNLGIIGGGQLGSMLSIAAKKLNIKTIIYSDDVNAPAQNFCDLFIFGEYSDKEKIHNFVSNVDVITYEFENIPYENINSIGKQWIRRFALALTKEMLGQVRGKFSTVPIPGESVTLNASELLGQARTEQDNLRNELKTILDETTYANLATVDATLQDSTKKVTENIPAGIFVG